MDLDAAFCRHWRPKKQLAPGSTATVALIRGGYELVTGHIGKAFLNTILMILHIGEVQVVLYQTNLIFFQSSQNITIHFSVISLCLERVQSMLIKIK